MARQFGALIIALVLLNLLMAGCGGRNQQTGVNISNQISTNNTTQNLSQITNTTVKPYPFDNKNMFFGWSIISKDETSYVKDLGMSWASLQPHAIWFQIEKEPGVYDWSKLDEEVKWLQEIDADITIVHSYLYNSFDPAVRAQVAGKILEIMQERGSGNIGDAFIAFNREYNGPETYGLTIDPLDPNDEKMPYLVNFVNACAERYDGDGIDDMPGLKYSVRVHHIVEEWHAEDPDEYLAFLKKLSPSIKQANPDAKIMIPGLYMPNFGRLYAYSEGYIDDPDAGVWKGIKFTRGQLNNSTALQNGKESWEKILRDGKDYFDIVDLHLYVEKETFMEGEIEYVKDTMKKYGYEKPIWCIEGGGAFKNPADRPDDPAGDSYFGTATDKEDAEYVVKFHAMSAAMGLERQHWGIGGNQGGGYWTGPWYHMALRDTKPNYYTYKIMREKLGDFTIGDVDDLSFNNTRLFEFDVNGTEVYVAWNFNESEVETDLSSYLGSGTVEITYIVTEMNGNSPMIKNPDQKSANSVPLSITPVFIEK
ncbi:MAG: hypothetical protein ABH842_00990 [Candidatus Micrarchaeota archaeon]